jgi:hypothetical protein
MKIPPRFAMARATAIEQDDDYRSHRRFGRNLLPAIAWHPADHTQDGFGHELKIQITANPSRAGSFPQHLADQQRELLGFPPIMSGRCGR